MSLLLTRRSKYFALLLALVLSAALNLISLTRSYIIYDDFFSAINSNINLAHLSALLTTLALFSVLMSSRYDSRQHSTLRSTVRNVNARQAIDRITKVDAIEGQPERFIVEFANGPTVSFGRKQAEAIYRGLAAQLTVDVGEVIDSD